MMYPPVETWFLPKAALELAHQEFRGEGLRGNENIALWFGNRTDGTATVTHSVVVRGPLVIKRPLLLQLEPDLMHSIALAARQRGVVLVGQIHSHPNIFLDLSPTDKSYGFQFPDFLSLVAPYYGLKPPPTLHGYGVHVFEAQVGYRRMSVVEAAERVQLTDGAVQTVEVGGTAS